MTNSIFIINAEYENEIIQEDDIAIRIEDFFQDYVVTCTYRENLRAIYKCKSDQSEFAYIKIFRSQDGEIVDSVESTDGQYFLLSDKKFLSGKVTLPIHFDLERGILTLFSERIKSATREYSGWDFVENISPK